LDKFFLEGIISTSKEAVELARGIKELSERDLVKIQSLGRSAKNGNAVFNHLFERPIINIDEICKLLNLTFPNAQNLVTKLIDKELLFLYKNPKRNRLFFYKEYLDMLVKY